MQLVLTGVFLSSVTILDVTGMERISDFSISVLRVRVPIGVLPYPITFLCTDLVSELYGRRRANALVCVGLLCYVGFFFILWLGGGVMPGVCDGDAPFFAVQQAALGLVVGSMPTDLLAQIRNV